MVYNLAAIKAQTIDKNSHALYAKSLLCFKIKKRVNKQIIDNHKWVCLHLAQVLGPATYVNAKTLPVQYRRRLWD